jgi:hypothetical protein
VVVCRVFGYRAFQTGAVGGLDVFGQIAVGRGNRKAAVFPVIGHEFAVDDVGAVGKLPTLRLAADFFLVACAREAKVICLGIGWLLGCSIRAYQITPTCRGFSEIP